MGMKKTRKKRKKAKTRAENRSLWVSISIVFLLLVSAIAILLYLELHREQLAELVHSGKLGTGKRITGADVAGFNEELDRHLDAIVRRYQIPVESLRIQHHLQKSGDITFRYKRMEITLPGDKIDPVIAELKRVVKAYRKGSLITRREIADSGERVTLSLRIEDVVARQVVLVPRQEPVVAKRPAVAPGRPRVAIIVDDIGEGLDVVRQLLSMDMPITFSILPGLQSSDSAARLIANHNREIMLHLPMEPLDYPRNNPGKEALFVKMENKEIRRQVQYFLDQLPELVGVNNHMGSRFTQDRERISIVLEEIKKRNLYFIDSVTSKSTVAYEEAVKLGVRAARRDVFLDHVNQPQAVALQVEELIKRAKKRGRAIAICHPRPTTVEGLKKAFERLRSEGIEIVPVSDLIDIS
jgi:polysaccharide deacetylase 2 family uncharacterized protein YibQ